MADQPLLTPGLRRAIIIDGDQEPNLVALPTLSQAQIKNLYPVIAAQPYIPDPDNPGDAKYEGFTMAEVIVRKGIEEAARTGDISKIEIIMDRLIGRPETSSKNVNFNLSGNYEEYLKRKVAELARPVDAEVVDDAIFGDLA